MKITVAGLGYVGLSNAILLARHHDVTAIDIAPDRVAAVNAGRSPIVDAECSDYLASGTLSLRATLDPQEAYADAELVIIATPTNYDAATHAFDTSSIEAVIDTVRAINPRALMLIKSTVPVGYTKALTQRLDCDRILFSPEFLREGRALYDNLHPSRIVVGEVSARGERIAHLLRDAALKPDVPVLLTASTEAEAIKLFANTYLALRVAFFNELDTIAMASGFDAREVIEGLAMDSHIGDHYNNPSFGYGGYCLPKDSKQLLANFATIPQELVGAIVEANDARKRFLADAIAARRPRKVGVYRLVMKQGSDNFRESAVQDIIARLDAAGIEMIVYEPGWRGDTCMGHPVTDDLDRLRDEADLIIANRFTPELAPMAGKVFTRDLFGAN
ncbi:MAG: UDP-glucose 6-dehydrogenase [Pararhodobacter sp.]